MNMRDPEFIIFTGPMFGSKTTRLLAAVDRYRYQNKKIINLSLKTLELLQLILVYLFFHLKINILK